MNFRNRVTFFSLFCVSLLGGLAFSDYAFAEASCPLVRVEQAGAASTGCDAAILVTNLENGVSGWPINETRWFCFDLSNNRSDAMLAVALTSLTTGKTAQICPKISNVFNNWAYVNQMWVTRW